MSDATLEVHEPATEQVLARVPRAGVAEVDEAVARAKAALPAWRALGPAARAEILRSLTATLEAHHPELALLEARNAGKPIVAARGEIGGAIATFRYFAAMPERLLGDTIPVDGGIAMTFREPIGVVGLITPWNFPLAIASWKMAPALAAGNTVVLKPAELTPLTALRFAALALEAGIPEGVVNVVVGPGSVCGARLVAHPDVGKIAFTGSTEVGASIAAGAARTIKRVTLELGGKSANVIFADADVEAAAAAAPWGVFDNAGQDCCARSRILVQASCVERFLEALRPAVESIVVGDPLSEATQMGPLISASHRASVASFLEGDGDGGRGGGGADRDGLGGGDGRGGGGRAGGSGGGGGGETIAIRGRAPEGPGHWFAPTVLWPVDPRGRAATEEIFGPIACVIPFADEREAIALANDSIYGLSGSIWTRDGARALRVARALESGNLSINSNSSVRVTTPFGGFKQSGYGRELGPHATDAYTEVKTIYYRTED